MESYLLIASFFSLHHGAESIPGQCSVLGVGFCVARCVDQTRPQKMDGEAAAASPSSAFSTSGGISSLLIQGQQTSSEEEEEEAEKNDDDDEYIAFFG